MAIFIELEQGTDEWKEWRRGGIGGSDAGVILGTSPYRTPLDVYNDKLGKPGKEDTSKEWIFKRGHEAEPQIRAIIESRYGMKLPPKTCQMEEVPVLRASLDGWNDTKKIGLECKLVGQENFELAKTKKKIPDHYYAQCQHNMLVTGGQKMIYACASLEDAGEVIDVVINRNEEWIDGYLPKAADFWKMVQDQTPPPDTPSEANYTRIIADDNLKGLVSAYVKAKSDLEQAKERETKLAEEVTRVAGIEKGHPSNVWLHGVTVSHFARKGSVKYDKIPELEGVNLDEFRAPDSYVTKITVGKEGGKEK